MFLKVCGKVENSVYYLMLLCQEMCSYWCSALAHILGQKTAS